MGEYTETTICLLKTEARQRYTLGEKGCGEEHPREVIMLLYRVFPPGLCLFLANYFISFPHMTCPRVLLDMLMCLLLPRWIPAQSSMRMLIPPVIRWSHPFLTPEEIFCTFVVGQISSTSRMRNMWSLYLLSKQDSVPPCSRHYLYLGVSVHGEHVPAATSGTHLSTSSLNSFIIFSIQFPFSLSPHPW